MSSPPPSRHVEDDDSENDPDFVPPAGEADSSSDSEYENRQAKKQKQCPAETDDSRAKKEESRTRLWEDFQASVSTPPPARQTDSKRKIKVVKKYRFAGEDVTKVEEVLENSEDAKKWPLWTAEIQVALKHESPDPGPSPPSIASSTGTPQPEAQSVHKRPGPRKPKKSLDAMFATAKAKKLSTLDKSAMDWKEHVESSEDIKDDLEANRKGGGYLEKVEFLQRVEQRSEAARQGGTKRRRV